MKIAITGSSGLVGLALVDALTTDGHAVTRVVRDRKRARNTGHAYWSPDAGEVDKEGLEGHDVVIHPAGASLFAPWTRKRKEAIRSSRVQGTQLLSAALAGLARPPALLISGSAIGYYGHRPGEAALAESDAGADGFLASVVRGWEAATKPADEAGIRVVHTRLGLVLARHGGIVGTMLPPFRLGLGAVVGSGDQIWSWIALPEIPHIVRHVIAKPEIRGPVNVVAPEAVSAAEFAHGLGRVLHRPVPFRVPAAIVALAPGGMGTELALASARVAPAKLVASGYHFQHPRYEPALRAVLSEI